MENSREKRKQAFINRALELFGNENLDYSKVNYINNRTKVCIIDHDIDENGVEYGEFYVTPSNFMKGRRHPRKRDKRISKSKRFSREEVIKKFNEVHKGEGLDYSKVEYVNMHTKVCIIDPIYGEYWQEPNVHLKGCCHPRRKIKNSHKTLTTSEFIDKATNIHGDTYDYSKVEYKNYRENVTIICKKHGEFSQTAENHLYGKGCPKCGNHYSKYEDDIISQLNERYVKNDRKILDGKEIDIFFPEKNIGIEFNGLKWHSDWFAGKDRHYHLDKTLSCNDKGVKLIHLFQDEYMLHRNLVLSKLKHILHESENFKKIYARKCNIIEITKTDAENFLNANHIQGFAKSTIYLGAYLSEELISVMTFIKRGNNVWELNRFASNINYNCIGFGGKLFKYFVRHYNPIKVTSFADRRWTLDVDDNLYTKIGFSFNGYTKPDYRYILIKNPTIRYHKFGFRKKLLLKKYKSTGLINETMTETEMTKALGYDRVWDCGLIKYIWTTEQ